MALIDTSMLPVIERLPGWRGRYFNSPSMTFAHYEFDAGATIHEHSHPKKRSTKSSKANWKSLWLESWSG
jgi:hypothetical protein